MFLPTMPQDDLEDVKEALLAARQNNAGENPVFYRKLNDSICIFFHQNKLFPVLYILINILT